MPRHHRATIPLSPVHFSPLQLHPHVVLGIVTSSWAAWTRDHLASQRTSITDYRSAILILGAIDAGLMSGQWSLPSGTSRRELATIIQSGSSSCDRRWLLGKDRHMRLINALELVAAGDPVAVRTARHGPRWMFGIAGWERPGGDDRPGRLQVSQRRRASRRTSSVDGLLTPRP